MSIGESVATVDGVSSWSCGCAATNLIESGRAYSPSTIRSLVFASIARERHCSESGHAFPLLCTIDTVAPESCLLRN